MHELRIFRFAGPPATNVTTFELWYRLDGLEAGKGTCFELHDCGPALWAFIDRYLEAWSTSDGSAIAALYADGATYEDGTLGIRAGRNPPTATRTRLAATSTAEWASCTPLRSGWPPEQ